MLSCNSPRNVIQWLPARCPRSHTAPIGTAIRKPLRNLFQFSPTVATNWPLTGLLSTIETACRPSTPFRSKPVQTQPSRDSSSWSKLLVQNHRCQRRRRWSPLHSRVAEGRGPAPERGATLGSPAGSSLPSLYCLIASLTLPEQPSTTRIPFSDRAFKAVGPHLPVNRTFAPCDAISWTASGPT